MAFTADPDSLDPHTTPRASAAAAGAAVYSRLLAFESGPGGARVDFDTVPDVAQFTEAPDARTFTVRLNPEARFTAPIDRALTSADVKYSFERVMARAAGALTAEPRLADTLERIETPDARTVTFRLKGPYGAFPQTLADARGLTLLPVESGTAFDPARQMVGSGPFTLTSYELGERLSYARNAGWHGGPERPYVDAVEVAIVRDGAERVRRFLAGELDVVALEAADLQRVRDGVRGAIIEAAPPLQIQNITFSGLEGAAAPWHDPRVRQAISMAIDRDAMLDEAFGLEEMRRAGLDVPYTWDGFLPWGITGYSVSANQMAPARLAAFTFDPAEAARLLDAAGWGDGFDAEWHTTGGLRGGYPVNARLVAQFLREVKINLRAIVEEHGDEFLRGTVPGNFLGMASIAQSLGEPGNYLDAMYSPGSLRNSGRVDDPRLTAMVRDIHANADREERRQQIVAAQGYLADRMYNVPLPNGPVLTAYQPQARNVLAYAGHGVAAAIDPLPNYWKA